jgi:hypothetical protein
LPKVIFDYLDRSGATEDTQLNLKGTLTTINNNENIPVASKDGFIDKKGVLGHFKVGAEIDNVVVFKNLNTMGCSLSWNTTMKPKSKMTTAEKV